MVLFLRSVTLNKAREFERRPNEEDEGRQLSASLAGDYTFDSTWRNSTSERSTGIMKFDRTTEPTAGCIN